MVPTPAATTAVRNPAGGTVTTLEDRSGTTAEGPAPVAEPAATREVSFDTSPEQYRHWRLSVEGEVATVVLDVAEDGGIVPGYELKMNSYDLGVDIELHDAVQRIRFEHPEVKVVVMTSGKERMFCAGANIKMLAASPHSWKVNFFKFTNETRNGLEDASAHSGLRSIAAVNGTAAGGGYELALACDEIVLVDDNSSAVSLPEVPLLGVLPGTGGLTRVVDKRGVRRDLADIFSTTAEGIRGERAVQWRLVDASVKARDFAAEVARRAAEAAAGSSRPGAGATGVLMTPLRREVDGDTTRYEHVRVVLDRDSGTATITVLGPTAVPASMEELHGQADAAWLLATTRELDDAILRLRANELEVGTWLLRTEGDGATVAGYDEVLLANRDDWLGNETPGFYRRTVEGP